MNPHDVDGLVRTLSPRERLTALLALAATSTDLELRMAAVGAARQLVGPMVEEVERLRAAVDAAQDECARLVREARR